MAVTDELLKLDVRARLKLIDEVTIDLVFRSVSQDAPRRAHFLAEQVLGIPVCTPPPALGARLALRLLGHDDPHGSASS
jgi:hypothetical protein